MYSNNHPRVVLCSYLCNQQALIYCIPIKVIIYLASIYQSTGFSFVCYCVAQKTCKLYLYRLYIYIN